MKVLIIGHGRMGQAIEALVRRRGHEIVGVIDVDTQDDLKKFTGKSVDVAIEFTQPAVAVDNYLYCLENGIKVITGTTGWLERENEVKRACEANGGTFLFSSNFSLGVNLFFKLNQWLAQVMEGHDYKVTMTETHHIHKKDAPSGTAITLAEGIIASRKSIDGWQLGDEEENKLPIKAVREGEVPGTHEIEYRSSVDRVVVRHEAFNRGGFVQGAVVVAEWITNKTGYLSMNDFLSSATNFE